MTAPVPGRAARAPSAHTPFARAHSSRALFSRAHSSRAHSSRAHSGGTEPTRLPLRRALARVALRGTVAATAAMGVARLHAAHDPGVLCPLRLLTGVPCPLCGSTTVFIELGRGDWGAALAANPVTAVAGLGLLLAPLGLGRRWWRTPHRARGVIVATALAAAWGWQLHRLGLPAPGAG